MKNKIKWVYLLVGMAFLVFANGRYSFVLAPWIAPIFLLNFSRTTKPFKGYVILSLAMGICCQISFWKFSSTNPYDILFYLPLFLGFGTSIPYLIDRLLIGNFQGVVKSLIFPATYTVFEFMYATLSPLGSTGCLAYTQTEFTSLIQIASITGIYGITFIITWFSSVAYDVIYIKELKPVKKEIFIYGAVLLLVLTFGGLRLLIPDSSKTVRVSGLNVYDLRSEEVRKTWYNVENDTTKFQSMCDEILNGLIEGTEKEAKSGSKIVVWSEISPLLLYQDQEKYINKIKIAAKENHVIIVASPCVLSQDLKGRDINKLLIINSEGNVILEHIKYGGAMFDNIIEGNKQLQAVPTSYGKLSGVICWDADFPDIMRQEGRLGTNILFSPAADWKEIDPIHSAPAYFRGIENGMSVLRQTNNGLSFASDSKGRYLAKMDHFTSTNWVTVAQIPTQRSFTLYPYIGDTFTVCNIIFLIVLTVFCIKENDN